VWSSGALGRTYQRRTNEAFHTDLGQVALCGTSLFEFGIFPARTQALRAFDFLLDVYGIERFDFPIGLAVQVGVLEVEIPARSLPSLFRTERPRLDGRWTTPFLEDQLAQHLVRTGRSRARGPTSEWLVMFASWWIWRFVAGLGNTVVRTYILE
jgi:hypothetical protein